MNNKFVSFGYAALGISGFVGLVASLANGLGLHANIIFHLVFGIGCAVAMGAFTQLNYPGERWPRAAALIALLVNASLLVFSHLTDYPATKVDLMFFAFPDAAIWLIARTVSYPATDVHQRAIRQQLIVVLMMALPICGTIMALLLSEMNAR